MGTEPHARTRSYWPLVHGIAAVAIAVLAVLVFEARQDNATLRARLREPQVFAARHELPPSPAVYELPSSEQHYLLVPQLSEHRQLAEYRLELLEVTARPKSVWRAESVRRELGEPLEVTMSREFLRGGDYRLDVYGVAAGKATLLEQFRIRIRAD